MSAVNIAVELEVVQLSRQVSVIPEECAVEMLTPNGSDQAFDQRVRLWGKGDRHNLFDLQDTEIGQPAMKSEPWIVVSTAAAWHGLAGSRVIEPTADADAVDRGCGVRIANHAATGVTNCPQQCCLQAYEASFACLGKRAPASRLAIEAATGPGSRLGRGPQRLPIVETPADAPETHLNISVTQDPILWVSVGGIDIRCN